MRARARLVAGVLVVGALFSVVPGLRAQDTGIIVISQVYGAGGNAGAPWRNDYVEIFNRGTGAASLEGLTVQYAPATGTGNFLVGATLHGTLLPGQYHLIRMSRGGLDGALLPTPDTLGSTVMAVNAGKVALARTVNWLGCNGGTSPCSPAQLALIVDLVGYGNADFFEGAGPAPAIDVQTAAFRLVSGCQDTNYNAADFGTNPPTPRNTASPFVNCSAPTDPSVTAAPLTAAAMQLNPVTLAATVAPGANPVSSFLQVSADLSAVASSGSSTQALLDDGLGADAVAGDNVFSASFFLNPGLVEGTYPITVTVTDGEGRDDVDTATLTVVPPPVVYLPHDVQGSASTSPLLSAFVIVEGVVTARTSGGFFMQTTPGSEDADPASSEGLFVFTGSAPPPVAQPGHVVRTAGTVAEPANPGSPSQTELHFVSAVNNMGVVALPAPAALGAADLPAGGSFDQLERFEGMRVMAASLTAVSGTGGNRDEASATSASDGAFYAVLTGTARPFREPGIEVPTVAPACAAFPLPCAIPAFDGNPERLRVDSDGLEGATAADVSTGDVVTDVTGPLGYVAGAYTLLPEAALGPVAGPSPAPVPLADADQFTVASFSMDRFFDAVDDPAVGDMELTAPAYANRLAKASLLVRNILNTPDVLGVQEVENLAALQDLAAAVNADTVNAGGTSPEYAAYLEEGNDPSGVDVGFLVKTAAGRVTVVSVEQVGLTATFTDPGDGDELLHDRPPLVLRAVVQGPSTMLPQNVTVINNHQRSLNGVADDSANGVRARAQRQAQAEFLASYLQGRQSVDPQEAMVSLGNYNAWPFNDGFGDSLGTVRGVPVPPDQVVTASPDLVTPDLVDLGELGAAADRYSVVFDGNAAALDHMLVTANFVPRFDGLVHAHVNADAADVLRNDPNTPYRTSDRDPLVAFFSFPPDVDAPAIDAVADVAAEGNTLGGAHVAFAVPAATDNLDGAVDVNCLPAAGSFFGLGGSTVTCSASDVAGNTASTQFSVTVSDTVPPALTLPADITAEASSSSGAVVTYAASATDVVGGEVSPLCAPASGTVFPVGTTAVQCVAGDGSGNSASGSFNVTVNAATSLAGVMSGAGQVGHGATATMFAFHVKETASGLDRGWLYLLARQPGHQDRFFAMLVTTVTFTTRTAVTFAGTGWWNGQAGYAFEVTATDGGAGKHHDTFTVVVRAPDGTVVASTGGALQSGRIQSRPSAASWP